MAGGNASASENQERAAAWPRRTRRIFVPFRPAGCPPMAAQIPRSGVCHRIWSRGRAPAFLWAVATPAPAKIRSRLRLGRAERDGFSCLSARRVARRWRRKSRAAGFVIESGAGVEPRLFLWAVATPAPAKIRSRLRQTNEAKNIWPGGICGMPPGQHCPEQFQPGEVEQQGRRGRQTVPLKGQRIHRRGCAFAEGCRL